MPKFSIWSTHSNAYNLFLGPARYRPENYKHGISEKDFSKVKAGFGGNIRVMASGSAPLSGEVQKFMKIKMEKNWLKS